MLTQTPKVFPIPLFYHSGYRDGSELEWSGVVGIEKSFDGWIQSNSVRFLYRSLEGKVIDL